MTAFFATALFITLFLLACSLVGGSAIRDDLADRLDDALAERDSARATVRDLLREQTYTAAWEPPTVRPFYGSDRHLRAVDALATSEARRFDPEAADWSEPADEWSER